MKAVASPNIALIKYWGKKFTSPQKDTEINIPSNPSLSFTLNRAQTCSEFTNTFSSHPSIVINQAPASEEDFTKITAHLKRMDSEFKLTPTSFQLTSNNNFPTGAGLASSASAYASITLAYLSFRLGDKQARDILNNRNSLYSQLCRMGSGSAARSSAGGFMLWQDSHATPINCDWPLYDTIILLDSLPKKISSSRGHLCASSSPLFTERLAAIPQKIERTLTALHQRDLSQLGPLIEEEALNMHAVMESSQPPLSYLSEHSRKIIAAMQSLKNRNFYFTIDAGPNIHIISETNVRPQIEKMLSQLAIPINIWEDRLGSGPDLE